jgi:hypothetical protein
MAYTRLSERDFDQKLREMGNYLWDLEQAADLASAHDQPGEVERLEVKSGPLGKRRPALPPYRDRTRRWQRTLPAWRPG